MTSKLLKSTNTNIFTNQNSSNDLQIMISEPLRMNWDRIKWEHKILRGKLVYKWKYIVVTKPDDSVREKFDRWKTFILITTWEYP